MKIIITEDQYKKIEGYLIEAKKAGFDKNPGVTRADVIVAAKGQAKKGKMVKKGMHKMPGGSMMKNSMMKKGGKMSKKCAYGC
jgi:hypothetical protein